MKRILLVDHNEAQSDMLARRLAAKGLEVLIAHDGNEGQLSANATKPDVILIELAMAQSDGLDCARRLKASPTTRDIPIVALGTKSRAADQARALKAGFDAFETKPVDVDALLQKIERLLNVTA